MYLLLVKKNEKYLDRLSVIMEKFKDITLADLKISQYF